MAVIPVSLHIGFDANVKTTPAGEEIDEKRAADRYLEAHLILTPDGDRDLERLGEVHLYIEAQAHNLPEMTPSKMNEWLKTSLLKFLHS